MQCRFLDQRSFHDVYRTFVQAFADYALDMSYMSEASFLNRAIKNGVDLEASVGAFDGGGMVGFTLVGLDDWQGQRAAFDIATGITEPYRGRGVANEMFDFALPKLREMGVRQFVLEVLQQNEPAVRAYRKAGFEIVREFDCYQLALEEATFDRDIELPIEIRAVQRDRLDLLEPWLDWQPSWENSFASIRRIPDELALYGAHYQGRLIGALGYYPALAWVTTVVVDRLHRRRGVATRLLEYLAEGLRGASSTIKIVNVEPGDSGMSAWLRRTGFAVYARQYEMARTIQP